MIQAQLADTRAQRAQLQASADDAVHALRTIEDDHHLGEQAVAAALDLAQDGRALLTVLDGPDITSCSAPSASKTTCH